jgi:hypothetical protein
MRFIVVAISVGLIWLFVQGTGIKLPSFGGGSESSTSAPEKLPEVSIEGSLPCEVNNKEGLTADRLHTCVSAKKYAKAKLVKAGKADQWGCLDKLWDGESDWSAWAEGEPTSKGKAKGIPQALGHGNVFDFGDWKAQVDWGLAYIDGRPDYKGSPCTAWRMWNERDPHWY